MTGTPVNLIDEVAQGVSIIDKLGCICKGISTWTVVLGIVTNIVVVLILFAVDLYHWLAKDMSTAELVKSTLANLVAACCSFGMQLLGSIGGTALGVLLAAWCPPLAVITVPAFGLLGSVAGGIIGWLVGRIASKWVLDKVWKTDKEKPQTEK